ncbi:MULTISPECIES: DUF968 domain-containing protein [unclassified Psychrobacter]|uniref:DUF968 domain-containing protein n=1 Tax=unclassified Psychrobacter TaxID=196806 RepID=UPI0025E03F0E|nr:MULTISPECIES: DUF968 domain-containing protein [unclassified Psychrobacter]
MSKRDNKRLEKVRSLPCCVCGMGPRSQAAHSNFSEHGKGRSIKADDKYTIPLCDADHKRFDQMLMGMDRNQSLEWFTEKLESTNETLRRAEDAAIQNYPECF